jgi:hypothetical protein
MTSRMSEVERLTQDPNTYRSIRDCKHGHLARSCFICELEKEIQNLKKQVEELKNELKNTSKEPEKIIEKVRCGRCSGW